MGCLNWFRKNWVIWRKNSKFIETSEGKMLKTRSNLQSAAIECWHQFGIDLVWNRHEDFLKRVKSVDPAILDAALVIVDGTQKTILRMLAANSNTAGFTAIIDKVSVDALTAAVLVRDRQGYTLLHWTAEFSDSATFIALIEKLSVDTLSTALLLKDGYGYTLLHRAIKNSPAFTALIKKVSVDALSTALVERNTNGTTPLHNAAEYLNSEGMCALIEKISVDTLSDALLVKDANGNTALHRAAKNSNTESFIAIINKLSVDTLSTALLQKNAHGTTPLHNAVKNLNSECLHALSKKATIEAFSHALLAQDGNGYTPLHCATFMLSKTRLIDLINEVSDEVLSTALLVKDKNGDTPLQLAAEKAHSSSNPTDFIALIEKVSIDSLSAALQIQNNHGVTPLHKAAETFNSAGCLALIEKVSIEALSANLLLQDHYGYTPLHWATQNANPEACLALIAKVSDVTLSDAISVKSNNGFTPLQKAALNSNAKGFNALIEKLSADTLSKALLLKDRYWDTSLHNAIQMANTVGLIASINKVNDDAIPAIIAIMKEYDLRPENVLAALLSRSDTFSGLSLFGNGSMMSPLKIILSESAFNRNLADIHHKFFTNKFASACLNRIWARIKSGEELLPGLRLRMQLMTVLMAKPAFSLTPDEIDFFRYLKKITAEHQDKIDTLIHQHLANRSVPSMIFLRNENRDTAYINLLKAEAAQIPDPVLDEVSELFLKIKQNEILIKIIAPRDHYDFIEQLKDYHYRPALRSKISNPKYKLVHLTGQVVAYNYHSHKNKPPYTHTKKSSATLLSSTLSTPVFGQHDPNRPLVGYLFNKKDCVIKAMLRQDRGTYCHQWLTQTEEEAKNAAHLIPNYNFTDESAFLYEINTDSSRTNEVLVKVKKEALVAIVVARKDSNSIRIAKERQNEVRDKLGLDLPVVFYDSNNGVLEMVQEKWGNSAQKLKIN
jgi:ankyrin repeat protein